MADEGPKKTAASEAEAIQKKEPVESQKEMTPAERIFVRINVVQTILAVAGVFTGAVALYAALNESAAVRRQSEAAVWPIIQLYIFDYANDDGAEFKVAFNNTGVGPGRIKSMRFRVNGVAARDWPHAVSLATGRDDLAMSKAFSVGRVIAAGESAELFSIYDRDAVEVLTQLAATERAEIDYCYCSIFDSCWHYESGTDEAKSVKSCPDYGADAFQE